MNKRIISWVVILSIVMLGFGFSLGAYLDRNSRPENKNSILGYENTEPKKNKLMGKNSPKIEKDDPPKVETNKDKKIYYKGKAVTLMYHHISKKPFSGITIRPERFERDVKMLVDNGFNVISLRQLINAMNGKEKLPDNAVVITFDDGLESFYRYAYPVLKKYKLPAVVFVITYRNEIYKPSKAELNPLSPMEIQEMFSSGLVDIQSHSHNSHDYVFVNPKLKKGGKLAYKEYYTATKTYEADEDYSKRVLMDLELSREVIKKYIGQEADMLCFPFGDYNKVLIDLAKKSGFRYFVTTQRGYNKENSKTTRIYRIPAGNSKLSEDILFENILKCANNKK